MSDFFFDPAQAVLFNKYDSPEYTVTGAVDSFLYKRWDRLPDKSDGNKFFSVPDTQYHFKLNGQGKPHTMLVHKDHRMVRQWLGEKRYGEEGREQPISYYKAFYSGSKTFDYDDAGRITSYLDATKFDHQERKPFGEKFSYDKSGSIYRVFGDDRYIFDDSAKLVAIIKGEESDGYYEKQNFKYDEQGRIIYWEEFGYDSEHDAEENLIYHFEKGILLMFSATYCYKEISPGITQCQQDFTVEYENPKQYRKTIIVYDSQGYKTSHEYYEFDGSLYERDEYHFEFDDRGNWIKMIKNIRFGNGQQNRSQPRIEREIYYSDGTISGTYQNPLPETESVDRVTKSLVGKIKSLFERFLRIG